MIPDAAFAGIWERNGNEKIRLRLKKKKNSFSSSYLLRNDMTSQATPRGHHPGPRRGEVLGTLISFQCQDKTMKGTKVLTSVIMITKEDSCAHGPSSTRP
jgi:hypothetical protein